MDIHHLKIFASVVGGVAHQPANHQRTHKKPGKFYKLQTV
jgi:hypothetical protein